MSHRKDLILVNPQNTSSESNASAYSLIDRELCKVLSARGISDQAIERARIFRWKNYIGYPIHPASDAQRLKLMRGTGAKQFWAKDGRPQKGAKPDIVPFFDAGDLAERIEAAGGVLILATGEMDVLACWSAGIYNVTCTFESETANIAPYRLDQLRALGVKRVIVYPDLDPAGQTFGQNWRAFLANTEIAFECYALPGAMGSKQDLNALWVDCEQDRDRFAAALDNCPVWDLPQPAAPALRVISSYTPPTHYATLYEQWCVAVERVAVTTWAIPAPNGSGWSRQNFSSPLREDRKPSAGWNYETHGFYDFGAGEFYNTHIIAELLGLPSWEDYKAQHVPSVSNKRRQKQTLQDAIQPVALPEFPAHQVVSQRYISTLPVSDVLAHRATLIRSPLGTGKTELVKRVIQALDQRETASVLVITHRQALARDIADRLGLECYLDIPDYMLSSAHRLVISYNSLHKIGTRRQWDLVVIDELEQFHQHLFGSTFKGGEAYRAYNALQAILRRAKHFTGLDAHLSLVSAGWTRQMMNTAPHRIRNDYRHEWGALTLHAHEDSVVAAALRATQQDRGVVVIPTSSRSRSEVYYRLVCEAVGPEHVKLVNGNNSSSAEIQQFIKHINTELPKLRVLICSPSFGTGLDVTAPVYGVFAVMLNRPLAATDMLQMLGRFRNAEQRHAYVQHLHQNEARDWTVRYDGLLAATQATEQRASFAAFGIGTPPPNQLAILQLQMQLVNAADVQKTDLVSHFVAYAQVEGFELRYTNARKFKTRRALFDMRQTLAEETKARVLAAVPVSAEAYKQHQLDGTVTADITAGYERWKIEHTVGVSISAVLYDDLHQPKQREALRRLTDLLDAVDRLQARDRQEAVDQVLLSQRSHYTTTRDLIWGGLMVVLGPDPLNTTEILTRQQIVERVAPWLDTHLAAVQQLVDGRGDLSADPLAVFRRLLAAIGLKLARKQVMRDGDRFMTYWVDPKTLTKWIGYARTRLAVVTANAEKTQPFRKRSSAGQKSAPASLLLPDTEDDSGAEHSGGPPRTE